MIIDTINIYIHYPFKKYLKIYIKKKIKHHYPRSITHSKQPLPEKEKNIFFSYCLQRQEKKKKVLNNKQLKIALCKE